MNNRFCVACSARAIRLFVVSAQKSMGFQKVLIESLFILDTGGEATAERDQNATVRVEKDDGDERRLEVLQEQAAEILKNFKKHILKIYPSKAKFEYKITPTGSESGRYLDVEMALYHSGDRMKSKHLKLKSDGDVQHMKEEALETEFMGAFEFKDMDKAGIRLSDLEAFDTW